MRRHLLGGARARVEVQHMKPVIQLDTSPAKGDALRACVASVFDIEDAAGVPNFIEDSRGYLPALQGEKI